MIAEEFLPIPGWPSYVVSRDGRVKRIRTQSGKPRDRLLRQCCNSGRAADRHWYVRPCQNGRSRKQHVHTLVAITFIGPRPAGMEVDHKDDNTDNNHADNLQYVFPTTNKWRYRHSAKRRNNDRCQTANGYSTPKSAWTL